MLNAVVDLKGLPQLTIARGGSAPRKPKFDPRKKHVFRYDSKEHKNQPHVVKFSGGRSSGMLLFTLLHGGFLNRERGDVVVFNNTSAEHPATYDFAEKCKRLTEEKYGIPFLWTEFQTYEGALGGDWNRQPSYRLVLPTPHSPDNPDGYHFRGEVFEEMLSFKRFLPNQFQRICTAYLKLAATREFLRDWFAGKPGIERQGHYFGRSLMDDETLIRLHHKNGGSTPPEVLIEKSAFVRARSSFRPAQMYADFSGCISGAPRGGLRDKSRGGKVPLSGDDCADYVSFVGFRGDEPARIARMRARNYDRDERHSAEDPHAAAPEGEYVYAPLDSMGVVKDDILAFWKKQKWDLRLPHDVNFSNCVYCFLKGSGMLAAALSRREKWEKKLPKKLQAQADTPGDIHWWVKMEAKYGRDLKREQRTIKNPDAAGENPVIGFWGMNGKLSYSRLADAKFNPARLSAIGTESAALPCDCTD